MTLELYKLPLGLTEGVDIPLPQTEIVFRVSLPSTSNEEFSTALMVEMNANRSINEEEDFNFNTSDFMKVRKDLFFSTCILSASGLPEEYEGDLPRFFGAYPLAKKFLFDKANEMSTKADEEVSAALEKLMPTQSGKSSGRVGKSNTKPSNGMASQ